ncbi:MAG: cell division protein FtsA [Candidatus Paceibacterota bacterium]
MRPQIICGIDIGNSAIKTVIAGIERGTSHPQILGIGTAASNGLRRGVVFDMEETAANIAESVKQAEAMAGAKVSQAYVSLNGLHIRTQMSRGVIIVSRADSEITQNDIDRVIDAAATINLPANREIIHIIPKNFTIDSQENVKNALGMKGVRLEADVLLVEGLSPYIRNLAKCVNTNDIEVTEFVFSPLAASKSVLDKHQKEHGVLNIDIGGGVSSVSLFHEGELVHTSILPIGSRHITNDIAVAFRTSMDKAEEIKRQYGCLAADKSSKKDQIDLSAIVREEDFVIPRNQIAKIVDSRVSEIFDLVSEELKKIPRNYLLPAGVVLTGGGSNLEGLDEFAKNHLRLSVTIGNDRLVEGLSDQITDPSFAVATGLVAWGFEKEFSGTKAGFSMNFSSDIFSKVGRWFKNFMP